MTFRIFSITLVCMVLGVIISWQYKSVYNNSKTTSTQSVRLENVKDEILREKKTNDDLRKKNEELEYQKKQYEESHGNATIIEGTLKKELENARLVAGLTDVKGKGIVITLDNGIGEVADTDLLYIANELKAAEAQAISINDERFVAMSEIRKGGKYIVINGQQIIRPYVIKAIAEPTKLENAIQLVGSLVEGLKDLYNIKYSIEKKDEVFVPKIDSSVIKTDYLQTVK